jgi:hypothetical protein
MVAALVASGPSDIAARAIAFLEHLHAATPDSVTCADAVRRRQTPCLIDDPYSAMSAAAWRAVHGCPGSTDLDARLSNPSSLSLFDRYVLCVVCSVQPELRRLGRQLVTTASTAPPPPAAVAQVGCSLRDAANIHVIGV